MQQFHLELMVARSPIPGNYSAATTVPKLNFRFLEPAANMHTREQAPRGVLLAGGRMGDVDIEG
jgi:hypothetical protein